MKKVLYVICLIIGGFLMLITLLRIPAVFWEVKLLGGAEAFGYLFGSFIFGILGFFLTRFGYRRLNPKKKKKQESIDDIGRS